MREKERGGGKAIAALAKGGGIERWGGREDQGRGDLSFSLAESRGKKVKEYKVTKIIEIVEMGSVETPPPLSLELPREAATWIFVDKSQPAIKTTNVTGECPNL